MSKKTYYFFIGTRAELIKLFPLIKLFNDNHHDFQVIASGQNDLTEDELFQLLKLEKKTIFLSQTKITKTTQGVFFWWIKTFFHSFKILDKTTFKTDQDKILIVHGDTVSTVMGAFLGKIYHAQIAHIEAGLRSFNIFSPFPEELDRVLTSHLTNTHFAPNQWAMQNLKNKKSYKYNTQQNTLLDSLRLTLKQNIKTPLTDQLAHQQFFIFVLHRQENLADEKFVKEIIKLVIDKVNSTQLKCLFILHENTKQILIKHKLLDQLKNNSNIISTARLNYSELMKLISMSSFMVTDGGSNQEECYYFGKPCCILRSHTERIEGLKENVILSKKSIKIINDFFDNYQKNQISPIINCKESPSKIIFEELTK